MHSKCLFAIVLLAFFALASARPKNKITNLGSEADTETKIREKRKYEIPLLTQLEESGVGVKREALPEKEAAADDVVDAVSEDKISDVKTGIEDEIPPEGGARVKKQSPLKIGGCGKTVCGPSMAVRGPVVSDMRSVIQGVKPIVSLGDLHSAVMQDLTDGSSKMEQYSPMQSRTVDTFVTPVTLGTLGYGTPAAYSAPPAPAPAAVPTIELGHSFLKPPTSVPAVAVIAAPHQPSHSLMHSFMMPHLLPHLMPHMMPHIIPTIMSTPYIPPHRYESIRYPEVEIKQPVPSYSVPAPAPYAVSGDNALLCQPYRNQRFEGPYDYTYKPDIAADKSLNVSDASRKSQSGMDYEDERKIHDHLRKVNEIKEEISQLNRAAQRIVDQQERLTAMQQKQMWGSGGHSLGQVSGQSSGQSSSLSLGQSSGSHSFGQSEHMSSPYMGSGYYSHPSMPWGYSRSNILSYPRSQDDIEFFINLLRAGKKMGLLNDSVQPVSVLSTIGDVMKGVTGDNKTQKDATDGVSQNDESKIIKTDKKLVK